jgi:glycosyltransferase involved in cell wall biosynthesis
MKILILTPYAPYPPNSGGRIRIWEQIKYLGQRHDITLISFYQTQEEYDQRDMLAEYCRRAILVKRLDTLQGADLEQIQQLTEIFQWYSTPEMKQALDNVKSENFDVVLFEHIFMAQYQALFSTCTVLQEHNIESNIFKQLAHLYRSSGPTSPEQQKINTFRMSRWMLMRKYENETWPKFPLRITVSQNDKEELDGRCSTGRTVVIENGINTRQVKFIPDEQWVKKASPKILFMGSLDFYPNIDCLFYLKETILPKLWQTDPTLSLVITGRNPSLAILDFAADPRIKVIANPEDIDEVAKNCYLTIVPMRIGSGTRIKILHSMALGLPVVSTPLGCEGLSVSDDHDILIRDTPEQFAEAILTLRADPQLATQLRTAGRKLVEDRYDWTRMFQQLETEMLALVNSAE